MLVDGPSKKNQAEMVGLTDTAKRVVFQPSLGDGSAVKKGEWVAVEIKEYYHNTLKGKAVRRSRMEEWAKETDGKPYLEGSAMEYGRI